MRIDGISQDIFMYEFHFKFLAFLTPYFAIFHVMPSKHFESETIPRPAILLFILAATISQKMLYASYYIICRFALFTPRRYRAISSQRHELRFQLQILHAPDLG